jgi:ABC-2 type transport system permease protein
VSGFHAVLRKEFIQLFRDKGALRFALMVPVFQLILFGLIDTNVRRVPTVVLDQSRTEQSRALLDELVGTSFFEIVDSVESRDELRERIVAGRASVGIEIPPDWARRRLNGQTAEFQVLIDGSDNSIASQTLSAASGWALFHSLEELSLRASAAAGAGMTAGDVPTGGAGRAGGASGGGGAPAAGGVAGAATGFVPIQPHPQVLFNPDSRSPNLLIPGLLAILLTFSGTLLTAFAIVRERERGTLEQLMVTPVSPLAVVVGKLVPYLGLAFVQLLIVLVLMTTAFKVPIHGSLFLLLGLAILYLFALLALGLLISSWARTQTEAIQIAQMILLPSILLSGYIFPLSSLPQPLQWVSRILPATYFIRIARGIIIRGATFPDLWPNVLALIIIASVLVASSTRAFRKTIA